LDQDGLWIDPGVINAEYGQIDPWVRVENNFVLPGASLPPEPLLPEPAAPIPQGALPGVATPEYTAGANSGIPTTPATSGPLSPARGREAVPYETSPQNPVTVPASTTPDVGEPAGFRRLSPTAQ
ncbi:MAG TPA: hypothetical protein VMP01_04410, partial [Pirellulaceae bacterium]|nr:hypothetical protein [Pirellulaceae bacterium]